MRVYIPALVDYGDVRILNVAFFTEKKAREYAEEIKKHTVVDFVYEGRKVHCRIYADYVITIYGCVLEE